jgi:hypothetical protein
MTTEHEYEFFSWSLKSKDENKPDVISLKLTQDIFETKYSPCIRVIHEGKEKIFSLQYPSLLKQIQDALRDGKIYIGKDFKIITYLGISKFHADRTPRRFRLEF